MIFQSVMPRAYTLIAILQVRDVVDFIDNLAGCSIYADEF